MNYLGYSVRTPQGGCDNFEGFSYGYGGAQLEHNRLNDRTYRGYTQIPEMKKVLSVYENFQIGEWAQAHQVVKQFATLRAKPESQLFWLIPLLERMTGLFSYNDPNYLRTCAQMAPLTVQKDPVKARVILNNVLSCCDNTDSLREFNARLGILLSYGDDKVPADPVKARDLLEAALAEYLDGTLIGPANNLVTTACERLIEIYEKGAPGVTINQVRANQIWAYMAKNSTETLLFRQFNNWR